MGHTILRVRLLMMFAPFLAGVLWLGMGGGAKHYDATPSQVKASLVAAYVPTGILGSTVKGSRVTQADDQTMVTALLDEGGNELMRFVTKIEPDGTGSSVETTVEPPHGKHAERAQEAMKSQGFTMSLMDKLAQEHVAAAIEHRPFDMMSFNPAAKQMAGMVPGMSEQIDQANRNMSEMSRIQQHAGSDDDDAEGGWGGDSAGSSTSTSEDDWGA